MKTRPIPEHLYGKLSARLGKVTKKTDHCWNCTAWKNAKGYALIMVYSPGLRFQVFAHRAAWTIQNGPIPEGLVIDHLCKNRACVNTSHMEVVTLKENTLRGTGPTAINARRATCKAGHPYSEATLLTVTKNDRRRCRICAGIWKKRYRAKRKAGKSGE